MKRLSRNRWSQWLAGVSSAVILCIYASGAFAQGEDLIIEAEAMTLTKYEVKAWADASGGQLIQRSSSLGPPPGVASTAFPGLAGNYDVQVAYFDESDGQSQLAVTLNGNVLDTWVADEDPVCGQCNLPNATTRRTRVVAQRLALVPGDVIAVEGTENSGEKARVDTLTLVLAPVERAESCLVKMIYGSNESNGSDGFTVYLESRSEELPEGGVLYFITDAFTSENQETVTVIVPPNPNDPISGTSKTMPFLVNAWSGTVSPLMTNGYVSLSSGLLTFIIESKVSSCTENDLTLILFLVFEWFYFG